MIRQPTLRSTMLFAIALLAATACGGIDDGMGDQEQIDQSEGAATDQTFTGTLSASGPSWKTYTFQATAGQTIDAVLDWTTASANLNLFLYDPTGKTIAFSNGSAKPEKVNATAQTSGTWTLGIKCKSGSSAYTLTLHAAGLVPTYPGRAAPGKLVWGAAVTGNGDPVARHEAPAGHPLAVRRTFYQWSQRTGSLVNTAKDDQAHSRLPWVSVKTPSWAEMGAGQHDAEIDQMLSALKNLTGPVWLTIHHEPEGGGGVNAPDDPAGPAGHIKMNQRVRARMTALGVKNVALAPILMSWTWNTASGRNPDAWWAPGIYDFLGVDHYQDAQASMLTTTWAKVRTWAQAKGVEIAVGEWGMRGTDAAAGLRMHEWYDAAAGSHQDGKGARVVGLSAYDSSLNSPSGSWELQGAQLTEFRKLLNDPRTADVVP